MVVIWLLTGALLGALGALLWARGREAALQGEVARLGSEVVAARALAEERGRLVDEAQARMGETIEAAASRAFQGNNEQFLTLAGERLAPMGERLQALEQHLRELERVRESAYGSLAQHVTGLVDAQETLRSETAKLAAALQRPGARGRWGEVQLRRIVELAGMSERCDFTEQGTLDGEDGRLRPDLVIHLPGGTNVVVDSKVPLDTYLAALESPDEPARRDLLAQYGRQVRDHMTALSRKHYWEQFDDAPDFVVMFVGVEAAYAAALEHRPELFEEAFAKRVVLATPSTLMALLRVVAFGWRQEKMAEHAQEVSALAKELHKRIASMAGHWATLGKRLNSAVGAFNDGVGALESRVLPQVRRFEDLGAASGEEVVDLGAIDTTARALRAPELVDALEAAEADEDLDEPVPDPRVVELPERPDRSQTAHLGHSGESLLSG